MDKSRAALFRIGLVCGVSALTALFISFIGGSWLYTDEPIVSPNSTRLSFSISITIGLWTVCPYVKKINTTIHFTSPTCSFIGYRKWDKMEYTNLEVLNALELAQMIVSKLKLCTALCGSAVVLIILAIILAILGHINNNKKILIACGMYILGGLSLGTGLVLFITYLTETLMEVAHYDKEPHFEYHYGWCFYLASMAFLLTYVAALLSILEYIDIFPTVDDMVKYMVPGGARKLQQHIKKSGLNHDYLTTHQYNLPSNARLQFHSEYGALTTDAPPDVCTTSYYPSNFVENSNATILQEVNYTENSAIAGRTVPITIKNQSFPNLPSTRYEIIHDEDEASGNPVSNTYQYKSIPRHSRKHKYTTSERLQVIEPSTFNDSGKNRTKKYFFGSDV